jgi:hypothetical protein
MIENDLYKSLLDDLAYALNISKNGELNKSRVIARQVAGKAIREIYKQLKFPTSPSINPYQYLLLAKNEAGIFKPIASELDALTTKVNPDYSFPEDLDLITYAKNIIQFSKNF